MKVKFKVEEDSEEFFKDIVDAFIDAKDYDNLDLAMLEVYKDKARYITSCDNEWTIERNPDGTVIFGYEGTRAGAVRLAPFFNLKWVGFEGCDDKEPLLKVVKEWTEVEERDDEGLLRDIRSIPTKHKIYKLKVVEYKTTTPPEWGLWWCDDIVPIENDKAVIMRFKEPIMVVPYKNVYF